MKRLIKLTSFLLCVSAFSVAYAQTKQAVVCTPDANEYQGWQNISSSIFSFYVPKELQGGERQGIDSRVWRYKSENLILQIDAGLYTGYPTVERKKLNYHEKLLTVDGSTALMWFYENEQEEFKYVAAVRFSFKGLNEAIKMELYSKDEEINDLAERIFKSVKFEFKREEEKKRSLSICRAHQDTGSPFSFRQVER